MEGKKLNYQFSIFGDFRDISPNNSQIIIDLLSEYKERNFIPSIFQEIPFNIAPSTVSNRIMLSNNDGWQMNIGNNRIDLSIPLIEKGKYADMNIETISVEACEIIEKIINKFNKQSNRIALNTTFLMGSDMSKKLDEIYENKGRVIEFYNQNKIKEWNERIISEIIDSEFNNEKINIGININKGKGQYQIINKVSSFDGIIIQFDINTIPENIDLRFKGKDIKKFFETAIKYKNQIEKEIEEKLV